MAGKIAFDIVLLPPEELMELVIEANRRLEDPKGGIELNKQDCLPHISLAMGCADTGRLAAVRRVLAAVAEKTAAISLNIIGVAMMTNAGGGVVSSYVVARSEPIQELHEEILTGLEPFMGGGVSADMFAGPGLIADGSIDWVRDYVRQAAFKNFMPHITIGFGAAGALKAPIAFTASRLALCQLGNHCTCRKVLAEMRLEA